MKLTSLKYPVKASWLRELGHRLDAPPFLSGAIEARKTLEGLAAKKEDLVELTRDGISGMYHVGQDKIRWVEDPAFGVPFLRSTDVLRADLTQTSLISKRQVAENPLFQCPPGATLITRSGTIGRTVYARREMADMAISQDVLKVVPDPAKIPAGYLYAYLSSRFGIPQIISGTFGSIIVHIEAENIADLKVPRLGKKLEQQVHDLVHQAAENRTRASELIAMAVDRFYSDVGIPRPLSRLGCDSPLCNITTSRKLQARLDAFYFCEPNEESRKSFDQSDSLAEIGEVADIFIPNIFKRRYADGPQWGVPYLTGADIFTLRPRSDDYLMASVASKYDLVLRKGMIVVQEAGQISGLLGRSVLVGKYLNGFACTNNMIRVVPRRKADAGYIFAVLNSEHGVRLVKREAAGSSIPHLERNRVARISIPWPSDSVRESVGRSVVEATELRDTANELESRAQQIVERSIEEAV